MWNIVADDFSLWWSKKMNERPGVPSAKMPWKYLLHSFEQMKCEVQSRLSTRAVHASLNEKRVGKKIADRPPAALYKSLPLLRKLYIFCITILLASHPSLLLPSPWPLYPKWETVGAIFCPKIHYKLEEPLSREKEIEWKKKKESRKKKGKMRGKKSIQLGYGIENKLHTTIRC